MWLIEEGDNFIEKTIIIIEEGMKNVNVENEYIIIKALFTLSSVFVKIRFCFFSVEALSIQKVFMKIDGISRLFKLFNNFISSIECDYSFKIISQSWLSSSENSEENNFVISLLKLHQSNIFVHLSLFLICVILSHFYTWSDILPNLEVVFPIIKDMFYELYLSEAEKDNLPISFNDDNLCLKYSKFYVFFNSTSSSSSPACEYSFISSSDIFLFTISSLSCFNFNNRNRKYYHSIKKINFYKKKEGNDINIFKSYDNVDDNKSFDFLSNVFPFFLSSNKEVRNASLYLIRNCMYKLDIDYMIKSFIEKGLFEYFIPLLRVCLNSLKIEKIKKDEKIDEKEEENNEFFDKYMIFKTLIKNIVYDCISKEHNPICLYENDNKFITLYCSNISTYNLFFSDSDSLDYAISKSINIIKNNVNIEVEKIGKTKELQDLFYPKIQIFNKVNSLTIVESFYMTMFNLCGFNYF
jgi:hypothetical protein